MAHGLDMGEVHHAELRQLHDYWLAKKGRRLAPARSDISPVEMRKLLPHVFLLEVVGCPPRFKFRLAGTEVVERYGEELTGRFLDEIDLDKVGTDSEGIREGGTRGAAGLQPMELSKARRPFLALRTADSSAIYRR